MKNALGDADRLQHIFNAIQTIERHLGSVSEDDFLQDELLINLALYQLVIIGEATNHLSEKFQSEHLEIPFQKVIGMRNFTIHEYFGVSFHEVWNTCTQDIPKLKTQLEAVKKNEESTGS